VILGASLGAVGYLIRDNLPTIEKVVGVMLIILGLNLAGVQDSLSLPHLRAPPGRLNQFKQAQISKFFISRTCDRRH
jgi:cytochrome c biogenesis protein CcdA